MFGGKSNLKVGEGFWIKNIPCNQKCLPINLLDQVEKVHLVIVPGERSSDHYKHTKNAQTSTHRPETYSTGHLV